jgi:hypothetical protein
MSHHLRALSIALGLLAATLVGCATTRPVQDPADYILSKHPDRVTLTRAGGSASILYHPHVLGDSVTGFDGASYVTLVLEESSVVEARRVDGVRTGVLLGTIAIGAAATLWFFHQPQARAVDPPSSLPCVLDPGCIPDPRTGCC